MGVCVEQTLVMSNLSNIIGKFGSKAVHLYYYVIFFARENIKQQRESE
jgi:hypothetical protein